MNKKQKERLFSSIMKHKAFSKLKNANVGKNSKICVFSVALLCWDSIHVNVRVFPLGGLWDKNLIPGFVMQGIFLLCTSDLSREAMYRWISLLPATKIQKYEPYHRAGKSVWSIWVTDLFPNKQTRHKRGKKLERFHESKWKLSTVA